MLEGFVSDALFFACFLICYCMFSCLFDMADPWKTMKYLSFSRVFLIFLGVGDVVRILKQHSICVKNTYQKRMENPWIFYGQSMEVPWKFHGDSMDIPWKFHGISTDFPWKFHGGNSMEFP